jgi:TonB family protein
MPSDYSFGHPAQPAKRQAAPGRAVDLTMGDAARGKLDLTPFSQIGGGDVGPDWRNALSAWVRERAYYPHEAVANGQSGTSRVRVVTAPDGRVTSVELEGRSGSPWLDLALLDLFRNARLPPLPATEKEPITFDFSMHYILLR